MMGWKNHNTKALNVSIMVYERVQKKKQAVHGTGLAFHLTVSSSIETFDLQVAGVKQGFGLRHHLSVTRSCASLIPNQAI